MATRQRWMGWMAAGLIGAAGFGPAAVASAQGQRQLDGVVAVVGDEPILKSDLDTQLAQFQATRGVDPSGDGVRKQVLDALINSKLILTRAYIDSVTVTEQEVQARVDQSYRQVLQGRFNGDEALLARTLGKQPLQLKREWTDDIRKDLLVEKLRAKKVQNVSVSRREVQQFYETNRDSLGTLPATIDLYRLILTPEADESAKAAALAKARGLLDSLRVGADFADLARRYSADPGSGAQGGDLGWAARGTFVPPFEAAAYALKPGELSAPTETQFGYHIIQLVERQGERLHLRHILVKVDASAVGQDQLVARLDSLRQLVLTGKAKFTDLARKYSSSKEEAKAGGEIGMVAIDQVDPVYRPLLEGLKEGDVTAPEPLPGGEGYQLLYARRTLPAHQANLTDDYAQLESLALQQKQSEVYSAWIRQLRTDLYWAVK